MQKENTLKDRFMHRKTTYPIWMEVVLMLWILIFNFPGENCETLLAPCSPKPCKNGGVCKESEDYESFSCVCPEGWQGTNFTNLIGNSVLASILCITVFIFCALPLAGQTCEVDINECVKNPCLNDAICQNSIGSYKCSCKSGYTSRNCETDIDDCKPS